MQHLFAVIADPHLHDVHGGYSRGRIDAERLPLGMELRLLADTVLSTRLYNESAMTFRAVLDDIAARGIRDVIVVGDYSDDGQDESVSASLALMRDYGDRFGIRFHATVGNHDVYGYSGRSLDRRFLLEDGGSFCVSGAQAGDADGMIFNPGMCCRAYAEGLPRELGFFRRPGDLHWESPFGASDALEDRRYEVASPSGRHVRRFIDASYLVEPVAGVWLLSIDANVFVPRDGDAFTLPELEFDDSTDAGYNALVAHRPYMLGWIADVCRRAAQAGKRLISFAHYPAVDPFDGTFEDERNLFGETVFVRRTPLAATSGLLAKAGLRLHFSGHLHIDNVSRHQGLINVAVPSTAGYPGGYRLLSLHERGADLETVRIAGLPLDPAIRSAYRRESDSSGLDTGDLLDARDFDDFSIRHLREVVRHRFFAREWTEEAQAAIRGMTVADLLRAAGEPPDAERLADMDGVPAMRLVDLLYTARHNAAYAFEMPPQDRRLLEQVLASCVAPRGGGLAARLLRMVRRHVDKPDMRRIAFTRDWQPVATDEGRNAA